VAALLHLSFAVVVAVLVKTNRRVTAAHGTMKHVRVNAQQADGIMRLTTGKIVLVVGTGKISMASTAKTLDELSVKQAVEPLIVATDSVTA